MAINTKMINVRIERYKERRRSGGRNMESERDRERERRRREGEIHRTGGDREI